MTEDKPRKALQRNFLASARGMVGSEMFKHIYVSSEDGGEADVLQDGLLSCAYAISSLLKLYDLIDAPHSTVKTTIEKMQEYNWQQASEPSVGAVAYYPEYEGNEHMAVVVGSDECISNSFSERVPVQHHLMMSNGQTPTTFYTHAKLVQ